MLSNGFDTTLHLKLRPSKILFAIRLFAHLLALLAISLPLNLYIEYKVGLYVFVILSLVFVVFKYINTQNRQRIFSWRNANEWVERAGDGDGDGDVVWICVSHTMKTPWFIIVLLKNDKRKDSIFIGADQCDRETYRRLYVRLKYLSSPFQERDAKSTDSS